MNEDEEHIKHVYHINISLRYVLYKFICEPLDGMRNDVKCHGHFSSFIKCEIHHNWD